MDAHPESVQSRINVRIYSTQAGLPVLRDIYHCVSRSVESQKVIIHFRSFPLDTSQTTLRPTQLSREEMPYYLSILKLFF